MHCLKTRFCRPLRRKEAEDIAGLASTKDVGEDVEGGDVEVICDEGVAPLQQSRWQTMAEMYAACWECMGSIACHPSVLLIPLAILAICITAGVMGMLVISDSIMQQRQEDARSEAEGRANVIMEQLRMASLPAQGLAQLVLQTPGYDWNIIEQGFNNTAKNLASLLESSRLEKKVIMQLAPAALISAIYPMYGNEAALGLNLLKDIAQREKALATIIDGKLFLAGPIMLKQGYMGAPVRLPIFVNGSYGPNFTFSAPNNTLPYNCSECYGERRFWGFATVIMSWDAIKQASKINGMSSSYQYRLTRPGQGTEVGDYILAQSLDLDNGTLGPEFISIQFEALTNTWTLSLYPHHGWYPNWRAPLISVVVVVSVVMSLLVGVTLEWNRKLGRSAAELKSEKMQMEVLMVRQYDLIKFLGAKTFLRKSSSASSITEKIDQARSQLETCGAIQIADTDKIQLHSLLGKGTFGTVFLGEWRGSSVAVKRIILPAGMSNSHRAEKMAVMEVAISSTLSHPHLVQTYTYSIRPLEEASLVCGDIGTAGPHIPIQNDTNELYDAVNAHELRLVLEYCDRGSLQDLLHRGGFHDGAGLNYAGLLETAADIAKGMLHLHSNKILHTDLKSGNIMLKSAGSEGRGVQAKVMDFGLSLTLGVTATHVSSMFQGTTSHMAPEALMEGKQSTAGDVYAFGVTLWEMYTGRLPYKGLPAAALGHVVVFEQKRPSFPADTPTGYKVLAERCWQPNPEKRPGFEAVLEDLNKLRKQVDGPARPLRRPDQPKIKVSHPPDHLNIAMFASVTKELSDPEHSADLELLADTDASWLYQPPGMPPLVPRKASRSRLNG